MITDSFEIACIGSTNEQKCFHLGHIENFIKNSRAFEEKTFDM